MKRKVKAQSGQVCRLSETLLVTDKATSVQDSPLVIRRIADGSLIDCDKKRGDK